ncbi:MAG: TIGR04076 family protein [Lachnospiraceae bacterium]|nr:TIGR04076 family protein [Lachnospiraceae bacterium]MDE6233636.1 TIGR04076 family protein [Lachnospiraceae bacterium]MDE6252967.1 TIGR04076 family protein [Lachnospiraceae bacterium]
MQHKVRLTVIDKKLYPELQSQYCADPDSGACPMYQVGDEFIFERYGQADDFWQMGRGRQCSEAWDAIARYIYTGLQGGSIMRGWMNDERVMIACCSDGTRPVIFKIERLDYKVLYIDGIKCDGCRSKIKDALTALEDVTNVEFKEEFTEVFLNKDIPDDVIKSAVEGCGKYSIVKTD